MANDRALADSLRRNGKIERLNLESHGAILQRRGAVKAKTTFAEKRVD
jgi:hypothetical protein